MVGRISIYLDVWEGVIEVEGWFMWGAWGT